MSNAMDASFTISAILDGFPISVQIPADVERLQLTIARLRDIGATPPASAGGRPTNEPVATDEPPPDAPASEKQRAYMDYLLRELGWDTDRLTAFAAEQGYNVLTLTKREASELIDLLKGVLAGAPTPLQSQAADGDLPF